MGGELKIHDIVLFWASSGCPGPRDQSSTKEDLTLSTSLWVYQSASLPVCQFNHLLVFLFASLPVCQYASSPVYQFISLPVYHYASLPFCQSASSSICKFTSLPVCQSVILPVFLWPWPRPDFWSCLWLQVESVSHQPLYRMVLLSR